MLRDDIAIAIKKAMIEKDKQRLSTLRLMNAAIQDLDIVRRGNGKSPAEESDIQALLAKMIKQRDESAKLYDQGSRPELAEGERNEIIILREFLPRQLDKQEMQLVISKAIDTTGAQTIRDMGKVMAELKAHYTGQMDFAAASELIKQQLQ